MRLQPKPFLNLCYLLFFFVSFSGCVPAVDVTAKTEFPIDDPTRITSFPADLRAAFTRVDPETKRIIICAEPSPDTAIANTVKLAAEVKVPNSVNVGADFGLTQALTDLAKRSQTLQLQREALYRLCELQANTGMDDEKIFQLYNEVLFSSRVIAMIELFDTIPSGVDVNKLLPIFESGVSRNPLAEAAAQVLLAGIETNRNSGADSIVPETSVELNAVVRELYIVPPSECKSVLAATDDTIIRAAINSTDELVKTLGQEFLNDASDLRQALTVACAT